MTKNLVILMALGMAMSAGTGLSTYPLKADAKAISAEFTGITSTGGGFGMQARYSQKLGERSMIDGGLGVSGGDQSSRLFAGVDTELIPDYESQPRVSAKAMIESAKDGFIWKNRISVAPILSKAYNMWGNEAFPYLSLPMGISLNGHNNTYSTTISMNIGIVGVLPVDLGDSAKKLIGTAEAIVGLQSSYSGVFLGASYPIL